MSKLKPKLNLQVTPDERTSEAFQSDASKNDRDLVVTQLESFFSGKPSPEQILEIVKTWADTMASDHHLPDDLEKEEELFRNLRRYQSDPAPLVASAFRLIFRVWVSRSKNRFAIAYRMGGRDERATTSRIRQKKATAGRKLIGSNTRAKVIKEAEKLKHLPKSKAALQIASEVHLSPEKVRAYLSELFPGDMWKK